eukprot:Blabericola_migrator_1__536@NODE_1130_length_5336_cov_152_365534_g770_i0_p1_GENE_NODE_1130_length_5336_cov_152_365534_g770_i0NODE_1130_length_5336_cov_152_365534_g770_i0_p1_ORF_typecomplete_len1124_score287_72Cse1/PF08506_10/3e26Cse1/PF08506_10/1_6e02IBN_N/PF03810_19/1_1e12IBN_N/PF03810_19/4_6e03HEAT_2/PF13646_6/85HEAT_2/PF13646_6/1_4e03HEAT_2/PF13646_6/0_33HEAT_EZ/PF13513_6/4_1e03HEAT_EZ/PF13513_6/2_1e02HEAT_EZ/PF13513_6/1_8e04HEAT_EZ/PF13513_6/2_5e02HEAT_EZ/PF13513_6/4_6HEAT_EZ/PF13513_6/1_5e0
MAAVIPPELIEALNGTTVADKGVRAAAEKYLKDLELQDGYLQSLLAVVADANADVGVRQIAAITLKNEIRLRWTAWENSDLATQIQNTSKSCYDDATRQAIKAHLLEVYLAIPLDHSHLRRQVEEAANKLIIHDYPDWTEANNMVVACLSQTDNLNALISGLNILRRITGKFEITTRNETNESKLEDFLAVVGPLMLSIVAKMGDKLFVSQESSFVVKMITKIYWSMSTTCGVHSAYLLASQNDWMQFLDVVLVTPVPEAVLPLTVTDSEAVDGCVAMKAKKWVLQTLRRFFSCFATSRTVTSGNNEAPFAVHFVTKWAIPFLNRLLEMEQAYVRIRAEGKHQEVRIMTPKLHSIVIEYFTNALETAEAYKCLKPKIEFLVTEVIHPALSYSEEDVMALVDDPVQYAWDSASSLSSWLPSGNSAKASACDFIKALPRLRGKDFLEPVATFCVKQMDLWNATPAEQRGVGSVASRAKDGALVMLGEFATRLASKKRTVSTESLIYNYLMPHLDAEPDTMLKIRSCWALGRLVNPNSTSLESLGLKIEDNEKFLHVFKKLLECGTSENMAVRVHAICSIGQFILLEHEVIDTYIKSVMINVVDLMLATLEKINLESIMNTLGYLVQRYPDEIIPHTPGLIKCLVACSLQSVTEEQEEGKAGDGSPFSLLSANAEDNMDSCMAAFSICKTINTVLDIVSVPKHLHLLPQLVPELCPFLDTMMSPDNEDFIEDALEALAYITFYPGFFPAYLWKYYERMYQAVCGGSTSHLQLPPLLEEGFAADSIRYIIPCLDNYLAQSKQIFLTGRSEALNLSYKEMLMLIIKSCFEGSYDPDSPAYGLQMLWLMVDNFVECLDEIKDLIEPSLQMAWGYLRKPKAPVARSAKEEMAKFLLTLMYAKPVDFFTITKALGVLDETLNLILQPDFIKSYVGKKIWVLAMINLIREGEKNPNVLPPAIAMNLATAPSTIIRDIAKVTYEIIQLKQSDGDEESDWGSVDSEQELDENEDAQPNRLSSTLFQVLANTNEEDDVEYEVDTDATLGGRLSPLDAVMEIVVVQNFMKTHEATFLQVLGADAKEMVVKIEEELQREEKEKQKAEVSK